MSGGPSCKCPESQKPVAGRAWVVIQRNGNASAFNGYRWQYSDYSAVRCRICNMVWRTKAGYVGALKDSTPEQWEQDIVDRNKKDAADRNKS